MKSTDEAERNRMQAIKCVVVGDGYAIILLYLHSYHLSCRQVLNQEVLTQLMHVGGGVWPQGPNFGSFDRNVKDFHLASTASSNSFVNFRGDAAVGLWCSLRKLQAAVFLYLFENASLSSAACESLGVCV